ncbi:hypothetical protein HNY73_020991 [Argiope bruennichi]|uniref:Uncharacterized protein n=1 Tax=Argiope bruennichi TaxID=94029 RepID=A0A8T0ECH8_ARGBR|nr:hypothetical protein HNY73_020991 [Argiope bruennichi]
MEFLKHNEVRVRRYVNKEETTTTFGCGNSIYRIDSHLLRRDSCFHLVIGLADTRPPNDTETNGNLISQKKNSLFTGQVPGRTFPMQPFLNVSRTNEHLYITLLFAKIWILCFGISHIIPQRFAVWLLITLTFVRIAFPEPQFLLDVPFIWANSQEGQRSMTKTP